MSSNNSTTIDEFGRDVSLKRPTYSTGSIFGDYFARFKGMKWIDIEWLLEEEEEEETRKENLQKVLVQRKDLITKGVYELEEGEELE